jgi:hypothetical protein
MRTSVSIHLVQLVEQIRRVVRVEIDKVVLPGSYKGSCLFGSYEPSLKSRYVVANIAI